MIRFSKIFKKNDQPQQPLPKGIKPEPAPGSGADAEGSSLQMPSKGRYQSSIKLSPSLNAEIEKERPLTPNIANLYDEIVAKAKSIYGSGSGIKRDMVSELTPQIEKIVESMASGSDELMLIALRDYAKPENIFNYHVANVTIIALAIGIEMALEEKRIMELGVAAFIHDIGTGNTSLLNKKDNFSEEEFERFKLHPNEGALALGRIDPKLNQRIIEAVKQEHERVDGSGYPDGLVGDEINEYAQIIGLADVYEALMHDRPYRGRYTSIDTIRIILKNKKLFSGKVVKALIEAFGIFPVETLVQLNTKEIGIVVKRDPELISRPVVDILVDSYGKETKQPKRITLADNPVIYIDNCVKQDDKAAAPASDKGK